MSANSRFLNLDTDGTLSANSDEIVPSQKAIKTYVDNHGSSSTDIDNLSITQNTSDEIQTIGVIDQNAPTTAIKKWTGTKAEYDAIATKDADTEYTITDDNGLGVNVADTDLSNLSNAGKSVIDGAYVANFYRLAIGSTIAGGATTTYDLSSYLPNDGQVYEVWGSMRGSSNTNLTYDIGISTTAMTNNNGVLRVVSGYSTTASSGAYVAIVGTGRDLSLVNLNANNVFNIVVIDLFGYRRIGTNA